jgi:hypothetical protein
MEFRKLFCMGLSSVLIMGSVFSVFADDKLKHISIDGSTHVFNESDFVGMNDFEKGVEKLSKYSLSPDSIVSNFSQETIANIGRSYSVTFEEAFLVEKESVGDSVSGRINLPIDIPADMVTVSKEEYYSDVFFGIAYEQSVTTSSSAIISRD